MTTAVMGKCMATHIRFVPARSKSKTHIWRVVSKYGDGVLGWIAWCIRWRKYAFYPKVYTLYEEVCLRDIASFCERRTQEYKHGN